LIALQNESFFWYNPLIVSQNDPFVPQENLDFIHKKTESLLIHDSFRLKE